MNNVFQQNKLWICFTYLLLIVEYVAFAALPYMLGKTIDGLLLRDYEAFGFWLGSFVAATIVGTARRRLDTRVFQRVWLSKSLEAIKKLRERGVANSFIVSRMGWIKTYGDFFEFTLPATFHAVIEVAVAIFMIWLVMPITSLLLAGLILVGITTSYVLGHYVQKVDKEWQILRERADAKLMVGELDGIEEDYEGIRKRQVQRSDLDALNWRWLEILQILATVIAIFALVNVDYSVGSIMTTLLYTTKLFEKAGILTYYFWHVKQIQMVDNMLEKL